MVGSETRVLVPECYYEAGACFEFHLCSCHLGRCRLAASNLENQRSLWSCLIQTPNTNGKVLRGRSSEWRLLRDSLLNRVWLLIDGPSASGPLLKLLLSLALFPSLPLYLEGRLCCL